MEKQLEAVGKSYDHGIELGRRGVDVYGDWPAHIAGDPDFPRWERECTEGDSGRAAIKDFLAPRAGMKFVDLGCCLNLMFNGYDQWPSVYHGVDISEKTIQLLNEFVAKKGLSVGALHCGSIHELPFESGYFDIGALIGVLEYYEPEFVMAVMREVHRILKPRGRLVLDIPDIASPLGQLMMRMEAHLGRPDLFSLSAEAFEERIKPLFEVENAEHGAMIRYDLRKI